MRSTTAAGSSHRFVIGLVVYKHTAGKPLKKRIRLPRETEYNILKE